MKKHTLLTGLAAISLLCGGINIANAATVPYSFSHHGLLYNGNALANGEFTITATLYDGEGDVIITKTQKVSVFDGFYNFTIDEIDPEALKAAQGKMELGIKVGNNDEMEPRVAINSVPFALLAQHAEKADDLKCNGCVGLEALDPNIQNQIQGTAGIYPAKAFGTFAYSVSSYNGEKSSSQLLHKGQNYTVSMDTESEGVYKIVFDNPLPDADYVVLPSIVMDSDFRDINSTSAGYLTRIFISDKTVNGFTLNTQRELSDKWSTGIVAQTGGGSYSGTTTVGAPISFVVY